MGTNYYWYEKPACACCERPYEPLHIGKSSAGWCFSLHIYPGKNINNLDDWKYLLSKVDSYILDEYDREITFSEMLEIITVRSGMFDSASNNYNTLYGVFYTDEGDFHTQNSSERGPNGLLRHRTGVHHCVGHGEGTWDYIIGDFS
jgi:hypothetical protein